MPHPFPRLQKAAEELSPVKFLLLPCGTSSKFSYPHHIGSFLKTSGPLEFKMLKLGGKKNKQTIACVTKSKMIIGGP